ncbi:MAG: DUF1194 domain-containing protein [Betaproteobacteria bacterium]|nr:DUF1194 domain-containing protein [Betaproteobacteria bacterium]
MRQTWCNCHLCRGGCTNSRRRPHDIASFPTLWGRAPRQPRRSGNLTDVQDGMNVGIASFANNGYEGARLVMDVSGDGYQNTDNAVPPPRQDLLIAAGAQCRSGGNHPGQPIAPSSRAAFALRGRPATP